MSDVLNETGVQDRVVDELNHAGVLGPEGLESQEQINTAVVEVVRLVQTLAREIDRIQAELDELRRGRSGGGYYPRFGARVWIFFLVIAGLTLLAWAVRGILALF